MVVAQRHGQAQPTEARIALLRPSLARVAAEARQLELPAPMVLDLLEQLLQEPPGTQGDNPP